MADQEYAVGDVVNDHVLIGEEWVQVTRRDASEDAQYNVGDVVNDHVWTGSDWVAVRPLKAPKGTGFTERLRTAREHLEQEQQAKEHSSPLFERCGRMVADGVVAGRRVKIYEKGYVQVGMFKLGEPEKLLGITAQDTSQQKTALGRAVGATVTMGANLILSPNKRGSLYLIIVTDKKTHNLTLSPPTNSDLKAMHKLEAAGRAVLATLEAQQKADLPTSPSAQQGASPSLADQLTQLTELHNSGALNDDEFAAAKSQLLSGGER